MECSHENYGVCAASSVIPLAGAAEQSSSEFELPAQLMLRGMYLRIMESISSFQYRLERLTRTCDEYELHLQRQQCELGQIRQEI